MIYPQQCGDGQCRFVQQPIFSTAKYSPLEYDSNGNIIGGGTNDVTRKFRCLEHDKTWEATMTEFEWAKDREPPWEAVA